jgi:hypothetical protein
LSPAQGGVEVHPPTAGFLNNGADIRALLALMSKLRVLVERDHPAILGVAPRLQNSRKDVR